MSNCSDPGDAGAAGGRGHGLGHRGAHPLVKGGGNDVIGGELFFGDQSARAAAAAIFISSLMSLARTSKAPRKMPGKASTLLI